MVKRRDLEGPIHRAILGYLRRVLPLALVFHVPSQTWRPGRDGQVEQGIKKGLGVVPGIPDLVALTGSTPLFFEVKAEGSYLSPAQKTVHEQLRSLGYRVATVRSIEDAREALRDWGVRTVEVA